MTPSVTLPLALAPADQTLKQLHALHEESKEPQASFVTPISGEAWFGALIGSLSEGMYTFQDI